MLDISNFLSNWGIFEKGMDAKSIQLSLGNHLEYSLVQDKFTITKRNLYNALSLMARDRMVERWLQTQQTYHTKDVKRIYYLSAEYLMGRILTNSLINLGIYETTIDALRDMELDLEEIAEEEPDMGLGNGGLGRLAACFLESAATLEIPCQGYGIRYEFGIFDQAIRKLQQVELPEVWLKHGNPWEIPRPEYSFTVKFYGHVKQVELPNGRLKTEWLETSDVVGIAYDTPIDGYGNETVNTLRLWSARSSKEFDLRYFQDGDYMKAVEEKNKSEIISKVLYPNDTFFEGRELRLKQQYFFVSCSIQDILRRYLNSHKNFDVFSDKVAIQMNDTHPSLAILELMRIFLDEHLLPWDEAWKITRNTCAYTNHTLLSEALEVWSVELFGNLLPRHLQILYEINRQFMRDVAVQYRGDHKRMARMSIIQEGDPKKIRMAHLAVVGSHSVNGVAELHSRLLKEKEFNDFEEMFPGLFNNKTNGVTPRRWLYTANPLLSDLIMARIGDTWIKDLNHIKQLESHVTDESFQNAWMEVKQNNKIKLAEIAKTLTNVTVDPNSIFDIQVKRIHEYKRQLLNILHVVYCWLKLKENHEANLIYPRTFFFGGKAAPGYHTAKQIIKLICHVAEMLNRDSSTNDRLKVVFLPNYRVTLAEKIFPAADVSEQISTAGFEASGTSNMKFALNGALTIGTLDGANIEIMEEVGEKNIFIFGLTAQEVVNLRSHYDPQSHYHRDPILKQAIDLIHNGLFSPEEPEIFQPLMDQLIYNDDYLVLADFESYHNQQMQIDALYRDRKVWSQKSIINTARMAKFSSDRTILQYNKDIWHVDPVTIEMGKRLPSPI